MIKLGSCTQGAKEYSLDVLTGVYIQARRSSVELVDRKPTYIAAATHMRSAHGGVPVAMHDDHQGFTTWTAYSGRNMRT